MRALVAALVVFLTMAQASPCLAPCVEQTVCVEQVEQTIPQMLAGAEARYDLPKGLLWAIAWTESKLNPDAIGAAGEVGIMQLHPRYHDIGGGVTGQIETAAKYLRKLIDRFGLDLGIAAYNQGPSNPKINSYVSLVRAAWLKAN